METPGDEPGVFNDNIPSAKTIAQRNKNIINSKQMNQEILQSAKDYLDKNPFSEIQNFITESMASVQSILTVYEFVQKIKGDEAFRNANDVAFEVKFELYKYLVAARQSKLNDVWDKISKVIVDSRIETLALKNELGELLKLSSKNADELQRQKEIENIIAIETPNVEELTSITNLLGEQKIEFGRFYQLLNPLDKA